MSTGDWIGLVRGDGIVSVADTLEAAAIELLEHLITDDAELVTVVMGEDATESANATIRGWLSDHRGNVTVEMQHGGQPLYPYLFGVE